MMTSLVEFTCDHCSKTLILRDMSDPPGWFMVLRDNQEWNFCSAECVCKQYQPAASALDEDWAF